MNPKVVTIGLGYIGLPTSALIAENKIPVFGRGVLAMPGSKKQAVPVNTPITAGGISVNPGDIIVADEEGIAVIPKDRAEEIYQECKEKVKKTSLEKFGTNNVMFNKKVLKNIKNNNLLKFGVEWPLSDKTIHKKTMNSLVKKHLEKLKKFNLTLLDELQDMSKESKETANGSTQGLNLINEITCSKYIPFQLYL